tara:strand:+ start:564 stop:839 length:276 start_codon:yes stop_codon:yes gene_type:complete
VRKYIFTGLLALGVLACINEAYRIASAFSHSYKVQVMKGRYDRCVEEDPEDSCHGRWKEYHYANIEAGKAADRFFESSLTGLILDQSEFTL